MYRSHELSTKDAIKICMDLKDSYNKRTQKHITFEASRTIIHGNEKDKVFISSATGKRFIDSTGFVDLVMGPYGSGKSTMCAQRIVKHAATMPYWFNNRRKARWAIVRNTSGELVSTTLNTWLQWFGDLGDIRKRQKPLLTYEHTFNDGHGVIELELIFIALDRPEDVRKIKSLELTGVYLNELSELPQNVLSHFKGRVNGRFPSKSFCALPHWSGIIADTNPPDEDHWIYRDFETENSQSYTVFHQPSGLLENNDGLLKDSDGNYLQNPHADNVEHLSTTYYPKLAEKQSEGFIKVYCCGRYGLVESGKRVYPEYNDDIHSVAHIEAAQGEPIYLAWDFGLTPACVVVQLTTRGQILVLKEYMAEDIGIRTFAKNIVIPRLAIDFVYNKVGASEGDPSGAARDDIMEELSCIGELNHLGIATSPAHTNDIDVRINSVRYFLNLMVDGKPAMIVSREGCPTLRKGFMSGYHFKRMSISGDERYQDKPNKNKYSHCFIGKTLITTNKGGIKIEDLKVGDNVLTSIGYKNITATMQSESTELVELIFNNGTKIICTHDHPFITNNGTLRADALQYSDILISVKDNKFCQEISENIQSKNLMELNITKKQKVITKLISKGLEKLNICIEMFGNFIMGKFPQNITFITSTTTKATMTLKTFNLLVLQNMLPSTEKKDSINIQKMQENKWNMSDILQVNGMDQKKDYNGIKSMVLKLGKRGRKFQSYVAYVINHLNVILALIKEVFVRHIVSRCKEEKMELITKLENVKYAKKNLNVIDTSEKNVALRLVQIKRFQMQEKVYDLTIEDAHCFYANGILVSNCHDALQYICMKFAGETNKTPDKPKVDPFANNTVFRWTN